MCCRICIIKSLEEIAAELMVDENIMKPEDWSISYNIAPGAKLPVMSSYQHRRRLSPMRWGLIPNWAETVEPGLKMANARLETMGSKPTFRQLVSRHHCLVPVSGYYEWQRDGRQRRPYFLFPADDSPLLLLAGLWDRWTEPGNCEIRSFTIITREARPDISFIHDRMPIPLLPRQVKNWLDGDVETLFKEHAPLSFRRVTAYVNDVQNDGPDCIVQAPEAPIQGELF